MGNEKNKINEFEEASESATFGKGMEEDAEIDAAEEEDGEEDVEEDDKVEEEEEEEYTFRFKSGMNPLDFTEDGAFGVKPYQEFERLEYEALAENKRKALSDGQRLRKEVGGRDQGINLVLKLHERLVMQLFIMHLAVMKREQGDTGQARYCISKAITRDPKDITLGIHRASLFAELGDYNKAAESYEQISRLCPEMLTHSRQGQRRPLMIMRTLSLKLQTHSRILSTMTLH